MTTATTRQESGLEPRLLNRNEAAAYYRVCPTTFDSYVRRGVAPKPIRLGKRLVWDKHKIDHDLDVRSGLVKRDAINTSEAQRREMYERINAIEVP